VTREVPFGIFVFTNEGGDGKSRSAFVASSHYTETKVKGGFATRWRAFWRPPFVSRDKRRQKRFFTGTMTDWVSRTNKGSVSGPCRGSDWR
jgi:hypothetical protein